MRGILLCGDEALHGIRPSVFSASSEQSYQRDAVERVSSRSPTLQPNLWFTLYPVGLYSGNFSLSAQEGLECVETGWESGEESPEAIRRQRGCGFLWPLLSPGSLKSYA